MKKTIFLALFFLYFFAVHAQWSGVGDIYYNSGNVGIGTSTPQYKLDILGSMRIDLTNSPAFSTKSTLGVVVQQGNVGNDFVNANNYLSIFGHNILFDGTNWIRRNQYSTTWATVINAENYDIQFASDNFSSSADAIVTPSTFFRINRNGNVGIGTSNPGSFKLAVHGKIGAREIQVTLANPFPDYVFEKKYQLRTLSALEAFINANKHLPGVPSAKEVEKEGGIELGKMNTILLEKIEELTLYVIQLNKRIAELENKNGK